jgi:hypothetical protein
MTRRNPALEQRHPPGCPDPDWCRGNGCYWDCLADPDADLTIARPVNSFDTVCARLDRLGIKPRAPSECHGQLLIRDSRGRHFFVTDILDRIIAIIEQAEQRA